MKPTPLAFTLACLTFCTWQASFEAARPPASLNPVLVTAATEVIDQRNDQFPDTAHAIPNDSSQYGKSLAQSFTPTLPILTAVELQLGRSGYPWPAEGKGITVRIRSGLPNGEVLGQVTTFLMDLRPNQWTDEQGQPQRGEWVRFEFDSPIAVAPGSAYVIDLVNPRAEEFWWHVKTEDPYSGGVYYGPWWDTTGPATDRDANFRTYGLDLNATPAGDNVVVTPPAILPDGSDGTVTVTFDSVTSAGTTTVTTSSTPGGGAAEAPPEFKAGHPPVYYDVNTTATFAGSVTLCFSWQEGQFHNEANIRLFHAENGAWVDVTTSLDTDANTVCGTVSSLSPFGVFEPAYTFTGFFQPVDNPPTRNNVKAGAAVPVKFSLNGDRGLAVFDPGFPASQLTQCQTNAPLAPIDETVAAGASSLSYDAATGLYIYVWKTDKAWAGSCRQLVLQFNDGSKHVAVFNFAR